MDTRTELLVQHAMAVLRTDRTSFVIAHRLSTIRDADTILVLEDGDIVEQGTHEKLLAHRGAYCTLYTTQFQGGQDLDETAVGAASSWETTAEATFSGVYPVRRPRAAFRASFTPPTKNAASSAAVTRR